MLELACEITYIRNTPWDVGPSEAVSSMPPISMMEAVVMDPTLRPILSVKKLKDSIPTMMPAIWL